MEGLPAFVKGDNVEDWLVQFSTWLNNQPNLDAVLRGLVARTDLPVTLNDDVTVGGDLAVTGAAAVTGATTLSGANTLSGTNTLSGATAISGALTVTSATPAVFDYAPQIPISAVGTVAAVFTANKGPTGLAVNIAGWIKFREQGTGTVVYVPYWVMA